MLDAISQFNLSAFLLFFNKNLVFSRALKTFGLSYLFLRVESVLVTSFEPAH